jgi:hypothetical protein
MYHDRNVNGTAFWEQSRQTLTEGHDPVRRNAKGGFI